MHALPYDHDKAASLRPFRTITCNLHTMFHASLLQRRFHVLHVFSSVGTLFSATPNASAEYEYWTPRAMSVNHAAVSTKLASVCSPTPLFILLKQRDEADHASLPWAFFTAMCAKCIIFTTILLLQYCCVAAAAAANFAVGSDAIC